MAEKGYPVFIWLFTTPMHNARWTKRDAMHDATTTISVDTLSGIAT